MKNCVFSRIIRAFIAIYCATIGAVEAQVSLDSSFGDNGKFLFNFSNSNTTISTSVPLSGGDIIGYGTDTHFDNNHLIDSFQTIIFRLKEKGIPDTTFGSTGIIKKSANYSDGFEFICTSKDSSIFKSGSIGRNYLVLKMHPNGEIDSGFGLNGQATFDSHYYGKSIAFDSRNRILQCGSIGALGTVCYKANGRLDSSFGLNGLAQADINEWGADAFDIKVLPDDKILVLAQGFSRTPAQYDFVVLKYLSTGQPDSSFGTNGQVWLDFSDYDVPQSMAIQPDGKILITGVSAYDASQIIRLLPGGRYDTSFNHTGYITLDARGLPLRLYKIFVCKDGNILAGGHSYLTSSGQDRDYALFRCTTNGVADTTFAPDGLYTADLSNGGDDEFYSMAMQNDGKIVLNGKSGMFRFKVTEKAVPPLPEPGPGPDGFAVYPNPAHDEIFIKRGTGADQGELQVRLIDVTGRQTGNTLLSASNALASVRTVGFAAGVYFIEISKAGRAMAAFKVIVK